MMDQDRFIRARSHAFTRRRGEERHDIFSSKRPPAQTTTIQYTYPGISAEEQRARRIQEGLLAAQLAGQKYSAIDPSSGNIIQRAPTAEEAQADKLNALLNDRLTAQMEGRMPQIPEETRALVNTAFQESQRAGAADIQRMIRELAGSRGLLPTDSPILQEGLRATTDLTGRLRGQEATALLNAGQAQNLFSEEARRFQAALTDRANANRALLMNEAGQAATGLAGLRRLPTSDTRTGPGSYYQSPLQQFAPTLQALGSAATGVARAGQVGFGQGGIWGPPLPANRGLSWPY